ncbi:MAG: PmoA family protein [Acidobacteria bacterium]|nr:PmoA family protein [Acidobacteriota bacterium]
MRFSLMLPLGGGTAALACGVLLAQAPSSGLPRLVLESSELAREQAWVQVQLPSTVRGADLQLRHEQTGEVVPMQIGPDREAWALLPSIPAEKTVRYLIEPALKSSTVDRVTLGRDRSQLQVSIDGTPAFRYIGEPLTLPVGVDEVFRRGGYIHPVMTPSGRRVTEDYPPNHRHHHGIWAAWTSTRVGGRSPDFWNMGDKKGRVEYESVGRTWSGPLTGGFETRHRYMDLLTPTPTTVLTEDWRVVAYAMPAAGRKAHVFDLTLRQDLVGAQPLELPTYRYGGVGMRGRHEWDGAAKTFFLTATGRTRVPGHGTRASWVHMSGEVDGQRAGLAMLSHPDNVRSPQPMRIHPTEPFFNFAPQQAGPLSIQPRQPFTARYRFVALDGVPDAAHLDALWQAYALPVRARVE